MEDLVRFLKTREKKLCVISTVNEKNTPESAVVGYAVKDDLSLVISTNIKTRKWNNVKKNPHVSLVIGWDFNELSIQYEGIVSTLEEGGEYVDLHMFFFDQNPAAGKFKSEGTAFILIKPTWIRITNPTTFPPTTEEKTF